MKSIETQFNDLASERCYEEALRLLLQHPEMEYETAFYLSNIGWSLYQLQRFEEAFGYFQKGLRMFPEDSWLYEWSGKTLNRLYRFSEAISLLEKAIEMGNQTVNIFLDLAWSYLELDNDEKALENIEITLMEDPENLWALYQGARLYFRKGDDETAERYSKKSYVLGSGDSRIVLNRIRMLRSLGRYEEALQLIETFDKNDELYEECLYEEAYCYVALNRGQEAIPLVYEIIEKGQDHTGTRELLGDAYRQANEVDQAKEQYELAISYMEKSLIREKDYESYQRILRYIDKMKDWDRKLEYLKEMSKFYSNDSLTLQFGETYMAKEEYEEAISYLDKIKDAEVGDYARQARLNLAECYVKLDQKRKALKLLKDTFKKYKNDSHTCENIADIYINNMEMYQEAIDVLKRVIELSPEEVYSYNWLAWCYVEVSKYREALEYLNQAAAMDDNNGWIYAQKGNCFTQLKQYEEAVKNFEKAIALDYQDDWYQDVYKYAKEHLK